MRWLDRFVEEVLVRGPDADGTTRAERLPDGRTRIVFRTLDAGADLTVMGPLTRAVFKQKRGIQRMVSVQLKPGWSSPLLGTATSQLTDRIVYLEELWGRGAATLTDRLLAARDVPAILDLLSDAIRARELRESSSARLARRALPLLAHQRVDAVAAELGISERHLRRAVTEHVGIAPREYQRALRLQRAVASPQRDWSRVAADAGYYDQAHLIGEFRDLVGLTPTAYAKR